jgi:glutathione S-transferase
VKKRTRKNPHAVALGRLGGLVWSEAKKRANKQNGRKRARADIDAISDFLGSKPFFMGDRLRSIDANVLSALNHISGTPFNFDTKDYVEGKKNLADYRARLNARFGKP